jgi:hypothetical protein
MDHRIVFISLLLLGCNISSFHSISNLKRIFSNLRNSNSKLPKFSSSIVTVHETNKKLKLLSASLVFAISSQIFPTSALAAVPTVPIQRVENSKNQNLYFGVGCFWHVQHEIVGAELKNLNRNIDELTVIFLTCLLIFSYIFI